MPTSPQRGISEVALKTLLVTDLVNSTKLLEGLGDRRAAEVFRRHDELARSVIEDSGGREIDKTDGFLILFDRPVDAVRCALAYHRGLHALSAELEALHMLGRHQEEVEQVTAAVERFPEVPQLVSYLSWALIGLGRVDEALQVLEKRLATSSRMGSSDGYVLEIAADELRAHGHRQESLALPAPSATSTGGWP